MAINDPDNTGNKPVARFQCGGVSASVFLNEFRRVDGSTFETYRTVLQRTYRDQDGNYKHTNTFGVNDLPKAILALQEAFAFAMKAPAGEPNEEIPF